MTTNPEAHASGFFVLFGSLSLLVQVKVMATTLIEDQSMAAPDRPLRELLLLAAPTVAQSVSYTVNQFIDTLMLSRLGADEPTAAGNAGMLAFSVICFGYGMLLVVNTLVIQNYRRGD